MTREEVLKKALEAVNGTRRENYGRVEDSFAAIAAYWSTYLTKNVSPKDVVNMMILMKVARLTGVPGNTDTYVDIAGYAACGGEIGYGKTEYEEPDMEVLGAEIKEPLVEKMAYKAEIGYEKEKYVEPDLEADEPFKECHYDHLHGVESEDACAEGVVFSHDN